MKNPDSCSTDSVNGPSVTRAFACGPRLIVRAWLLSVSPAPPLTAPPRAASSWPNS